MIALAETTKGWFRKLLCTALPAALTENTNMEMVLQHQYGDVRLDVLYQSRAYCAFGMEHYTVSIKIDDSISNIRKIRNAGLDLDDVLSIPAYSFEGSYKGGRHYHLSRYTTIINKLNVL